MAISFQGLGNEGRLGNQMFQYAFVRGVAYNRGFDWIIPGPDADRLDNYGLFDCFELYGCRPENQGEPFFAKQEVYRDMAFNEKIFNECEDNTNFSGNFQTEFYFEQISADIRHDFTFKKEYLEPCQEFIDSNGGQDNNTFLHVRRGNPNVTGRRGEKWSYQMVQEYHPICKKEYYIEALKEKEFEGKNVVVVSDTIDWCKKQDWLQGDRFLFSDASYEEFGDGASVPYIDLCLMTLCGGGIIANSSLSWWGAWLQKGGEKLGKDSIQRHWRVVAPEPWFGIKYDMYDMKDLIPPRWLKLYNDPSYIEPE